MIHRRGGHRKHLHALIQLDEEGQRIELVALGLGEPGRQRHGEHQVLVRALAPGAELLVARLGDPDLEVEQLLFELFAKRQARDSLRPTGSQ
jgi:hypothetical protein